jgi:hypothetical protein
LALGKNSIVRLDELHLLRIAPTELAIDTSIQGLLHAWRRPFEEFASMWKYKLRFTDTW